MLALFDALKNTTNGVYPHQAITLITFIRYLILVKYYFTDPDQLIYTQFLLILIAPAPLPA